jgi:hypothetical protein
MRNNREYQICKDIAIYLRIQYPNVLFHFDLAGLNLSRAQAGMTKGIQGGRGWPDLFIAEPKGEFHGLFLELKTDLTRFYKKDGSPMTSHIEEQMECLQKLWARGYQARFAVGFDNAKKQIDNYLKCR